MRISTITPALTVKGADTNSNTDKPRRRRKKRRVRRRRSRRSSNT
jgi:hypothetical protein